eukprot:809797_1
MAQFAFLFWLQLLIRSQSHTPSLLHIEFDEITTESSTRLGWLKILSCNATTVTVHHGMYDMGINKNLSSYAMSMKIVPTYSTSHPKYAQYALMTKPCSNPIFSLNNQKELSFTMNATTGQISGEIDLNEWIGTANAKARLVGDCLVDTPSFRSLYLGGHAHNFPDQIYDTCSDIGLRIIPQLGICQWETDVYEDINVYIGFDANRTTHCNSTLLRKPLQHISTVTEPISIRSHRYNTTPDTFDETSTYSSYDIGWIKGLSCSNDSITTHNGYTIDDIKALLPFVISMRISTAQSASDFDDFTLETIPCSLPIYAINKRKEMTWNIHAFNLKIQSAMSDDEWIGSSTAKQRLHSGGDLDCRRYLGLDYAREFPVIYSNCDQGLRIDIDAGLCEWDVSNPALNRDMEIHFGFDEDMNSQCIYDVDHVNITSSQRYILVPYPFNGFDAQLFCEQHFDTSLAMIVTDENLQEALDLRYSMGLEEYDMWIGLHKSIGHDASSWHWYTNDTDAMWCDYTTYDGCIFDTHWVMSVAHDDADEVQSQCAAMVGYADTFEAYTAYSCGDEKPFLCDRHNSVEDVDPNAQTCDVFIENEIEIAKQVLQVEDVIIGELNLISFALKLEECTCAADRCNILQIGNEMRATLPSVFITGNDLEIRFFDAFYYWRADVISNVLQLLCDGNYHQIDLIFTMESREYRIDDVSYYLEETYYEFSEYIDTLHPLYVSSPWEETFANAQIKDICIKTLATARGTGLTWTPVIYIDTQLVMSMAYWNKHVFMYALQEDLEDWNPFERRFKFALYYFEYTFASHGRTPISMSSVNFDYGQMEPAQSDQMKTYQDDDTLYIIQSVADSDNEAIFTFNLTAKSLDRTTIIPQTYETRNFSIGGCIANDDDYLYLVFFGILLYDKSNDSFIQTSITSNELQIWLAGCATTLDQRRVFIFGGDATDKVYEYDIMNDTLALLSVTMMTTVSYDLTAVASANGKIHINGAFGDSMDPLNITRETHVFDVATKQFESYSVADRLDCDCVNPSFQYVASSNLLMKLTNKSIDVLIADHTSIDFTPTASHMWRSNVSIDYNLFDFTTYDGLYKFVFQLTLSDSVQYVLMIDAMHDKCYLCEDDEWRVGCLVGCHIPIHDNTVGNMTIQITPINQNIQLFPTSSSLHVAFHKCIFDIEMNALANNYAAVEVNMRDTDICASHPSIHEYVINMYNATAGIDHNIIVMINTMVNITRTICTICHADDSTNCVACLDGIQLQPDLTLDGERSYIIQLLSNTTDLRIYPARITVPFQSTIIENLVREPLSLVQIILIVAASLLLLSAAIVFGVCFVKNKKLAEEVQRQKDNTKVICNPLVLYIGIAKYEEDPALEPGIHVYCRDLDGVDVDATNVKLLCHKFHYDLHPMFEEEPKLQWSQKEVIAFLLESANNVSSGDYDSLLAIFSGHGYQHNIITSDYQLINKDAILRIFTMMHPELCSVPRIFIFDCCDGERQRDGIDESDSEEGKNVTQSRDVGKNFQLTDIKKIRSLEDRSVAEEAKEAMNSNYNVVTIHAANIGFQSKLNSIDGSYVINAFVRKMLDDIGSGHQDFFGEIMQDIQHKLHEDGKQYPTNVFHDNTRYLKFSAYSNNEPSSSDKLDDIPKDRIYAK